MNDKDFLRQALNEAFFHPRTDKKSGLDVYDYSSVTGCLRFCGKGRKTVVPFTLAAEQMKKYAGSVSGELQPHRNPALYEEYEVYKHELSENVVMPGNYPHLAEILAETGLPSLSRQEAQKRKISAALFPAELADRFSRMRAQDENLVKTAENLLEQNSGAYDVALLDSFAALYKKSLKKLNGSLILWLNKKRLRYYLNEAAQLLKSGWQLAPDFYADHPFAGAKISPRKVLLCKNILKHLLFSLQKMSHDQQLLDMAQVIVAGKRGQRHILDEYRSSRKSVNLPEVAELRRCLQNMCDSYAFVCYLDGVRRAFEHNLENCPETRHKPLPTVSPANELKKILKIAGESKNISAADGKLKRLCVKALSEYDETRRKLLDAVEAASPRS